MNKSSLTKTPKQNLSFQHASKQTMGSTPTSKIHPLGQKSKNLIRQTPLQQHTLSILNNNMGLSYCRFVKYGIPVSFNIDRKHASYLLNELHQMKIKYSQLQKQLTQNSRIDASMMENITQSTKNLELRMSQVRLQQQLQNQFQREKDREQYQILLKQKQNQIENCNQIIETLNQATQKINELQAQNNNLQKCKRNLQENNKNLQESKKNLQESKKNFQESKINLQKELQDEKLKNKKISKQNQLLFKKINQLENGKDFIIKGISLQLQKLKNLKINKEQCSILAERIQEVIEQHYSKNNIQQQQNQEGQYYQNQQQFSPNDHLSTFSQRSFKNSESHTNDLNDLNDQQDISNQPQQNSNLINSTNLNEKRQPSHSQTLQETLVNINDKTLKNNNSEYFKNTEQADKISVKSIKSNKLNNSCYRQ